MSVLQVPRYHPLKSPVTASRRALRNSVVGTGILLILAKCSSLVWAQAEYQRGKLLCQLECAEIVESSGLASSHRNPGLLWTHNDSGDLPRIFAFDEQGRHRGECQLRNAEAIDWEDMGSFTLRGGNYLFIADVGDNARKREQYTIYLIDEPDLSVHETPARPLHFRYEDGPHDCEAVALDTGRQVFILVEKVVVPGSPCRVYELSWKSSHPGGPRIARQIGSLKRDQLAVPWVTGLDISPDGRRAVIATYGFVGLEYRCDPQDTWQTAFAKPPREIVLPSLIEGRRQGEAICYGLDGITLYLSSEKHPCPLFVLRPTAQGSPP